MRFRGSGIGHRGITEEIPIEQEQPAGPEMRAEWEVVDDEPREDLPDSATASGSVAIEVVEAEREQAGDGKFDEVAPEEDKSEEELAYGYRSEEDDGEDEEAVEGSDIDEDDFGPEDGEDEDWVDVDGEEGYAPL